MANLRALAVVMPVYNEEECIVPVIQSWRDTLSRLKIDFVMIVMNDGSTDGTRETLAVFEGDERIRVTNKENRGHGPTVLMGYRMALAEAEWVFQTDSDNEMKPDSFPELWNRRADYDALFGVRQGRIQGLGRRLISGVSQVTLRVLFANRVEDGNTPYRLLRSERLRSIVEQIPHETFAPNLLISGMLSLTGARIVNLPVPHEGRKTGSVSIVKWKLWKGAMESWRQTLCFRLRNARRSS